MKNYLSEITSSSSLSYSCVSIPSSQPSPLQHHLQQGDLAVHLQCAKHSNGFNIVDKLDYVNTIFMYNIQNNIYIYIYIIIVSR